ncbi:MAG: hypothetical protein WAX89_06565, partial [Alphaproteobacteria bacterium]
MTNKALHSLLFLTALMASSLASAEWTGLAGVSDTFDVHPNRLCAGADASLTIGCPVYAPNLDASGNVSTTGYVSATAFYGDGSNLTGITTNVSVTTGTSGSVIFRDQFGSLFGSNTLVWSGGNVGVGTAEPSATLHIMRSGSGVNLRIDKATTNPQMIFAAASVDKWGFYHDVVTDIGTFKIRDWYNGVDVMTFNTSSNVGIGTTDPQTKLEVAGIISNTGISVTGTITATTVSASGNMYAANFYGSGANLTNLPAQTPDVTDDSSGTLVFTNQSGALFASNTLVWSDGNVGIGTSSPLSRIHGDVGAGSTANIGGLIFGSTSGGTFTDSIGNIQQRASFVVGTNWGNSNGSTHGLLNLYNANGSKLFVTAAGNVGIGTITPTTKLEVAGIISSTGISVTGRISATTLAATQLCDENGANCTDLSAGIGGGDVSVTTGTSGSLVFRDQHGSLFGSNTLVWSNGKVGVGKTTPAYPLDISTSGTGFRVTNGAETNSVALSYNQIYSSGTPLYINNGGNNVFLVSGGSGNVGIGTTDPQTKLEVAGIISSTGISVTGRISATTLAATQLCDENGANCTDLSAGIG